jgi:hypothetical protein
MLTLLCMLRLVLGPGAYAGGWGFCCPDVGLCNISHIDLVLERDFFKAVPLGNTLTHLIAVRTFFSAYEWKVVVPISLNLRFS